jgi:hypothetical protein
LPLKKSLAILALSCVLLPEAFSAPVRRTRKIVCKRGTIRVTTIDGIKKYSCVVKTKKKSEKVIVKESAEPSAPFLNGPLRYQANWWGRVSARTVGGPTLASNRYRGYLEAEQDISTSGKFVLGGRATHDLMSNFQGEEFRDDFSRNKKPEIELWNAFGEYRKDGYRLRVGQQQIAWGETFGFFYADLVNPKDLRERSLGRLSELRLPTPMANLQWSGDSLSVQFLYLPFFKPDRNPTPKSDFFPNLTGSNLPAGLTVDTSAGYKLDDSQGDVGGRISGTVKGVDISVLYFDYIDRQPYYTMTPTFPTIVLDRRYRRIQSTGLTFSTELEGGWIIRSENVYTPSRSFNSFDVMGLTETKSSQRVHVLGIDAPKWEKAYFGLQLSNDSLKGGKTPFQRPRDLSLASFRIAYDLPEESMIEALIASALGSGGELIQATYTRPLSDIHELEIYWDQFHGGPTTFFGQTEKASRIYIGFRGAFNG